MRKLYETLTTMQREALQKRVFEAAERRLKIDREIKAIKAARAKAEEEDALYALMQQLIFGGLALICFSYVVWLLVQS